MKFLCPRHRLMFANLSLIEQNDLWVYWMENALTLYESRDSEKVIIVTGNAFDIACLARTRNPDCMHVELTLSAILLCSILRSCGKHCVADDMLLRALESLRASERCHIRSGECGSNNECIEILLDASLQPEFFTQYLNWPSCPVTYSSRQSAMMVH
ncbi:MAG TPA: hypothetical protein ENH62_03870 [Marinobacter sp.]|uniref:Uncharacterized protein n=2 Tax=root TaxID=1 RepID=A0A831R792_9GAMM|nr:hypothetical protein [Marinobacter antarcticus]HDZ37419.1 hypothetical protein [Marinobacter sp.]HEA53514.1 hypothetical protein [Marinobacter antarcticus]